MIDIDVCNMAEVPALIERVVVEAVRRTWQRLIGDPADVLVILNERNPDRSIGYYDSAVNVIGIGVGAVVGQNLPLPQAVAIVAAHEATHKAQTDRGDTPPPSYRNWRYDDCPFEHEAWREAVHTASEMFPSVPFHMVVGEHCYASDLETSCDNCYANISP